MSSDAVAAPPEFLSRPLPYPKTARQAEFMELAERLGTVAAEYAAEHDRSGTFPAETLLAIKGSGFLALTVPEEFGGRGADPLEIALAIERLARGDGSVGLGVWMHLGTLARQAVVRSWPPALYARVCRAAVEGGALINSAISEPDLGSPSRGGLPSTTAVRTAAGWRLNGRKSWASLAPALTFIIVGATIVEEGARPRRANFLVPADAPGIRIEQTWDTLGMRSTGSDDLILEDVEIAADALLPPEEITGVGESVIWTVVSAAVYTGIAVAARDFAVEYARSRRPSGQQGAAIAEYQTVQHRVAEMEVLLLQSRAVTYGTAEAWIERPELRPALTWQASAAKYVATNNAIRVTDLALRVVGSAGLARSLPLERYFRDARAGLGNPPMDDVALSTIGKGALGVP